MLEGKDREQLIAIATALGLKATLPGQEGRDHRSDPRADRRPRRPPGRSARRTATAAERANGAAPATADPPAAEADSSPSDLPTGPSAAARPRSTTSRRPTGSWPSAPTTTRPLTRRQRGPSAPTIGDGRRPSPPPSSPSAGAEVDRRRSPGAPGAPGAVHRPPRRPQRATGRTDPTADGRRRRRPGRLAAAGAAAAGRAERLDDGPQGADRQDNREPREPREQAAEAALARPVEELGAGEPVQVAGYLDLRDEGYGFLRVNGYLPSRDDVYVSVKQTRQYGLRKGDHVTGLSRARRPQREEPGAARDPHRQRRRSRAGHAAGRGSRTSPPLFPDEKLRLENPADPTNMTARIIDLDLADRQGPARASSSRRRRPARPRS